ncbi:hypothetical protein [Tessaracoccus antarcticus]|uniref:DUF2029 domain-containing protein n=1 Tax=Tessaracoccus antarcticus TaxID=2479848 RepID=A0A3M0GAR8_9ACTN|nr:hypothetical protein [Tessaracoccus antarcticus]RMB61397.1 hypothetical protein EAX62_01700 [Tessaracoccus antarcticus]
MKNALLPGLGGPMGRHAKASGPWFNPLPWTILVASAVFAVLAVRQVPCIQTDATNRVDAFVRLCYSDIPLMWTGQEFGLGNPPFGGETMVFSPVLGVLMLVAVKLAGALGAVISPDADVQVQLDGAQVFFAVNAVLLFVFFLAWVVSMTLMGRESRGTYRSWDGMLIAAAPVVLASGLIHWDLLPIGLTAIGLYQFSRRRVIESGIVLGLAAAAGTMPLVVILAVTICIALRGRGRHVLQFLLPAAVTWGVVHLPLLLRDWKPVLAYYQGQVGGESSYGSLWFLLQLVGWNVRGAGYLGFALLLVVLSVTIGWLFATRLKPRVGTLVGIFVFVTCMLGAAFSPQTALWLLFALVLARPLRREYIAFTVVQVVYYVAIWGYLSGHLTPEKTGNPRLYFLAIGLRLLVEAGLVVLFYRDILRPTNDPLRAPDWSDPLGGVLVDGENLDRLDDGGDVPATQSPHLVS